MTILKIFFAVVLILFAMVLSYCIGSISSARIMAKWLNIDLHQGSNNPGATNVSRLSKLRFGTIVAVVDLLKIIFAGWLSYLLIIADATPISNAINNKKIIHSILLTLIYLAPTLAVFGHCFPVYHDFKNGGKGAASFVGLVFFINPWLGLMIFLFWWMIALTIKYVSLASIINVVIAPWFLWIKQLNNFYWIYGVWPGFYDNYSVLSSLKSNYHGDFTLQLIGFLCLLVAAVLVIFRHRANIQRLIKRQENKFVIKF